MWTVADRIGKTISNLTVGTVIVLVHVALADRERSRSSLPLRGSMSDGSPAWRSQISP